MRGRRPSASIVKTTGAGIGFGMEFLGSLRGA